MTEDLYLTNPTFKLLSASRKSLSQKQQPCSTIATMQATAIAQLQEITGKLATEVIEQRDWQKLRALARIANALKNLSSS